MNAHTLIDTTRLWLQRHPRRLTAALAILLLGTGVTAFGTGPLDAALKAMPRTTVVQAVALPDEALAASTDTAPFVLHRSDLTRRDDTLATLLQRLGVRDTGAIERLRREPALAELWRGPAGKLVSVDVDDDGRLLRLQARWLARTDDTTFQRLDVRRASPPHSAWNVRRDSAPLNASVRLASGTIRSSLFAATEAARLPDAVASQLADLLGGEIDFRRDLRAGDTFAVVYEALEADGELLRYGRLLGAEFVNNGRRHQLVWFQPPGSRGAYYTFEGESLARAFLASPLAFTRVSSGYGMRFHPVHGDRRAHLGVDYAAPTGTPVRAVADASVAFAGWQRGYGNVVVLQHTNGRQTLYAHLSRIDVRKGQRLEQGQTVGAVGATGTATGPHLHFEYIVNGQHRDPMTIARDNPGGEPIEARWRSAFVQHAAGMRSQLAAAATLVQASAE
ncbi:M23 family metallopeptidase [Tepidimonas charontis]|uniref:Murein DD-endopeptidase MepM n=1 Tax=Tepidimonas charontis TaxID=2267262 RepID=A0A554XEW6_9BURK|nr:M23 family metallopeptidase [Tepidimonas charontis]TSE34365.1 Murein DD-endopeptidase MepM [Tepidimonas charontis]